MRSRFLARSEQAGWARSTARDTKLGRDVAIKILPDAFASDEDRVARFTREAQTLAALNHPHIAQIHGFEESSPSTGSGQAVRALVMELVDGEDLAQRIARGAIPIDEALTIARQSPRLNGSPTGTTVMSAASDVCSQTPS